VIAPIDVVTYREVSGYRIARSLGTVRAEAVCARDHLGATLRSLGILIGIIRVEHSPETRRARRNALDRLTHEASQLGASAVIGLEFETRQGPDGSVRVRASGEAVLLAQESP
jgi:uncharacterized protein YbjQ (UPF0145 family)